jgi:hypothetical protein
MVSMQTPYGNGRSEERTLVKNGLNQALVEKAIWVPIALAWFESWEKYMEYEGFNKEVSTNNNFVCLFAFSHLLFS